MFDVKKGCKVMLFFYIIIMGIYCRFSWLATQNPLFASNGAPCEHGVGGGIYQMYRRMILKWIKVNYSLLSHQTSQMLNLLLPLMFVVCKCGGLFG